MQSFCINHACMPVASGSGFLTRIIMRRHHSQTVFAMSGGNKHKCTHLCREIVEQAHPRLTCVRFVQEAQHLYRIRHEVAVAEGRHMSDAEWAEAAGMPSIKHLHSVLAAGEAAGLRIIEANRGQLVQLTSKFASQVSHASMYYRRAF